MTRPKQTKASHAQMAEAVAASIDLAALRRFGALLRRWYRKNARDLPWRRTRDPYQVLVSELMLQQTQVSRVVEFYGQFLERFPTLHHVARAPVTKVLEQWEGLGYYARARNLHKLARTVVPLQKRRSASSSATVSSMPSTAEALRRLPGVGAYTAGAVASFAFEERAALVDTNVARVLLRVFAPAFAPKSGIGQKVAWALASAGLPRTGRACWTHNQALMELGALVCTAREKRCHKCPLARCCLSFE